MRGRGQGGRRGDQGKRLFDQDARGGAADTRIAPATRFERIVMSNPAKSYKGGCFCGAVEFTVTGQPAAMGYCHCESCRRWSAGPVNAFTLWKPEALQITQGANHIGTFNKTVQSYRKWCKNCGGHVFTEHP